MKLASNGTQSTHSTQSWIFSAASAISAFILVSGGWGAGAVANVSGRARTSETTYSKDIAPLLVERCAMCHHAGGSAPFSLLTFADAKRRATQIADVTRKRFMPPWKADPHDGPFIGQQPLDEAEIALIARWVAEGAVEGATTDDRREQAESKRWSAGWQLGPPDLVLTLPQAYTLPAEGTDAFRIFVLPIPVAAVCEEAIPT